jgi:hypothetical protein
LVDWSDMEPEASTTDEEETVNDLDEKLSIGETNNE